MPDERLEDQDGPEEDRWRSVRSPLTPEEQEAMFAIMDRTTYRRCGINLPGAKPLETRNIGALILPTGRDGTGWEKVADGLTDHQWARVLLRALVIYGPAWRRGAVMALPVHLERLVPVSVYSASATVLGPAFGFEYSPEHLWWWLSESRNRMDVETLESLTLQIDARIVEPIPWDHQLMEFAPWPDDERIRAVTVPSLWWQWDWRVASRGDKVRMLQRLNALVEQAHAHGAQVLMDTLDIPEAVDHWREVAQAFGVGWIGAPSGTDADLSMDDWMSDPPFDERLDAEREAPSEP